MSTFKKLMLIFLGVSFYIHPSLGQDLPCFLLKVGKGTILNGKINTASLELVGTKPQILDVLKNRSKYFSFDCRFKFGPPMDNEFEPATCISDKVTFHFVNSPEEMLKFYRALIPPRIPPAIDIYKLNSGKGGSTPSGLPCKAESELCISSKGEMSVSVCCDDFCFGVSSEGEFTVSAGKGPVKVSLTFP